MNVAKADYDKALADAIYVYDKALANAKVVYEQAIAEADYVYQCHFNVAKAGYQTDLDNAKVDYDRAVYVKGLALDTAASIKADDDEIVQHRLKAIFDMVATSPYFEIDEEVINIIFNKYLKNFNYKIDA